MITFYSAVVP